LFTGRFFRRPSTEQFSNSKISFDVHELHLFLPVFLSSNNENSPEFTINEAKSHNLKTTPMNKNLHGELPILDKASKT